MSMSVSGYIASLCSECNSVSASDSNKCLNAHCKLNIKDDEKKDKNEMQEIYTQIVKLFHTINQLDKKITELKYEADQIYNKISEYDLSSYTEEDIIMINTYTNIYSFSVNLELKIQDD